MGHGLTKFVGGDLVPLGRRKITGMSKSGRERYLVYLPESFNELWRELKRTNELIIVSG